MATVKIRNIVLGAGLPKIAVPNVGSTEKEIMASAEKIKAAKPDLMNGALIIMLQELRILTH